MGLSRRFPPIGGARTDGPNRVPAFVPSGRRSPERDHDHPYHGDHRRSSSVLDRESNDFGDVYPRDPGGFTRRDRRTSIEAIPATIHTVGSTNCLVTVSARRGPHRRDRGRGRRPSRGVALRVAAGRRPRRSVPTRLCRRRTRLSFHGTKTTAKTIRPRVWSRQLVPSVVHYSPRSYCVFPI